MATKRIGALQSNEGREANNGSDPSLNAHTAYDMKRLRYWLGASKSWSSPSWIRFA